MKAMAQNMQFACDAFITFPLYQIIPLSFS